MATPILPPDLTAGDFADALEAFRRIVGSEHVYIGEALSAYVDPYSIAADPDAHATPAAVAPDSAEQVQAILKVANQYERPALADFLRQEPRLWRRRAAHAGHGRARPQPHEPHPRGQRRIRATHWSNPASATSTCIATSRKRA